MQGFDCYAPINVKPQVGGGGVEKVSHYRAFVDG